MYIGADLSYVNEVEDCGGTFYDRGTAKDPFEIFREHGANIVRVRLWHTPTWTAYSNLTDTIRTIQRAKSLGMSVLLDFHYSDTWADPAKQIIPAAWTTFNRTKPLAQAMQKYTIDVLLELEKQGLMPEFVQVGNEINTEILRPEGASGYPINWERNVQLINAGIDGVREAGQQASVSPTVMLHIAQPENVVEWFDDALEAGIHDFDVIGLSYYPKWSKFSLSETGTIIGGFRQRYQKDVMVVETAYPWTLEPGQSDEHLIGADGILPDYPPTPEGQKQFLIDLTQATVDNGGTGVIYWEPAWISTPEKPSIWENATLFNYQHEVHEGIEFLSHDYLFRARE